MTPIARRVLVLQLARLGDILQTTPMLRGFRLSEPQTEVTLVLQDRFQSVPIPHDLYDRLVSFPFGSVRDALREAPWAWRTEVERVRTFVESLGTEPFDLLLNFTHSALSSYLCSQIPHREAAGLVMAPDRTQVNHGPWLTYFFASISGRSTGCFNLVDLHNRSAGVPSLAKKPEIAIADQARDRMDDWLAERGLGQRPIVAVQLGASEAKRMYPPDVMASVLDQVPAEEADVVFVGVSAERSLADETMGRLGRAAHSAVGQTSVSELAALLERSRLLLTVDTGTMHVAAAVGTRIVALFAAGPVFVHRTGPYGEGHLVVEPTISCFPCETTADCRHFACHNAIPPADIAATVRYALGTASLPTPSSARILRGSFAPSGRLEYRPVWPAVPGANDIERMASARVWEETLGVPSRQRRTHRPSPMVRSRPGDGNIRPEFVSKVAALDRLAALADKAAATADLVPAAAGGRQNRLAVALRQALDEMELVGELESVCRPLVVFTKVRLNTLLSGEVARVARGYAREYRDTAARARRLAGMLSDTSWLTSID